MRAMALGRYRDGRRSLRQVLIDPAKSQGIAAALFPDNPISANLDVLALRETRLQVGRQDPERDGALAELDRDDDAEPDDRVEPAEHPGGPPAPAPSPLPHPP